MLIFEYLKENESLDLIGVAESVDISEMINDLYVVNLQLDPQGLRNLGNRIKMQYIS